MRRAPLIGVGVAVALTVVFYFLLYRPAVQQEEDLRAQAEALVSQQGSLRAQIAQLEGIRDDQPRIAAELARLEELIPDGVAQPSVIRQFQAAADAAGVEISSVSFAEPSALTPPAASGDGRQLGTISTTMVINGGYFQAVDFFRRLEVDTPRAVLFRTVAMAEGEEEYPVLTTTWTGDLFALIPLAPDPTAPVAPGASPSPSPSPSPAGVAPATAATPAQGQTGADT